MPEDPLGRNEGLPPLSRPPACRAAVGRSRGGGLADPVHAAPHDPWRRRPARRALEPSEDAPHLPRPVATELASVTVPHTDLASWRSRATRS